MTEYQNLLARKAELEAQIAQAQAEAKAKAVTEARALIQEHGLTSLPSQPPRTTMTPEQKLKHAILLLAAKWKDITLAADAAITAENVDALYEEHDQDGMLQDARNELRSTGEETGLSAPGSRNYETEAVAKQMPDGSWVGWTHYYGGGKHSDPDSIPWMNEAYDVNCTEEQVMTTRRTFTKP